MMFRLERAVSRLGWTRWVQPVARGYLMRCCDCGLVHEMDFRVKDGRVQFRARRKQALRALRQPLLADHDTGCPDWLWDAEDESCLLGRFDHANGDKWIPPTLQELKDALVHYALPNHQPLLAGVPQGWRLHSIAKHHAGYEAIIFGPTVDDGFAGYGPTPEAALADAAQRAGREGS